MERDKTKENIMTNVRKIKPGDYKETGDMIKTTIAVSFRKLYPEILLKEFCNKYDLDKFSKKAADIEMFVATEKDEIIGVIGLKDNQLRTFYVHPNQQGKGVGSKLYKKFEELAVKRSIKKITLEGSPLGQPIYEHFGFVKVKTIKKKRVGQKYIDAVMEKHL